MQTRSTSRLNIAVAGTGLIGKVHHERSQASPECQVAAIIDPSPAAVGLAQTLKSPSRCTLPKS